MKALFVLLFLLCAAPAHAEDCPPRDPWYRVTQFALLGAHGADLGSTVAALERPGFTEANPALRWASDQPAVLGTTKMLMAAAQMLLTHEVYRRGHHTWAKALNVVVTGAIIGVAVANTRRASQ